MSRISRVRALAGTLGHGPQLCAAQENSKFSGLRAPAAITTASESLAAVSIFAAGFEDHGGAPDARTVRVGVPVPPRNQSYLQGEVVGFRRPLRLYGP